MSPEAFGRLSHASSADSALGDAEGLVAEGDFDVVACVEGESDVVACAAEACFVAAGSFPVALLLYFAAVRAFQAEPSRRVLPGGRNWVRTSDPSLVRSRTLPCHPR